MIEPKLHLQVHILAFQLRVALNLQPQLKPIVELDLLLYMEGCVQEYLARPVEECTVASSKDAGTIMRGFYACLGRGMSWYGIA